jgi:multiple sugar transport system substrate-binding protein
MLPVSVSARNAQWRNLAGFAARYLPSTVQGYSVGGSVYGIPLDVSNVAFWINAATFRATGLDPARNVPRTWDQVARLG